MGILGGVAGFAAIRARTPASTSETRLVRALGLGDPVVDRLASRKPLAHPVPVRNSSLAQLPAQQDRPALDLAGEVKQSDIKIFYLDASRIDFSHCILDPLNGLLPLRLAPRHVHNIDLQTSAKEYAVRQLLQFLVHGLDQLFAVDGSA